MTETQKRINAYRKALPHMKERVTAVALLLAISVAMMTSATFAWMTLSRSPEVSSMLTTVTTNGNLEIALSGQDGLQPADTTVSDGGRDITQTNLTWGNLINLSSESYGLSDITLRPATLDRYNLNTSPIYATKYSADGRVDGYMTDFSYTSYDASKKAYMVDTQMKYGVRAISSVTYKQVTGDLFLVNQLDTINKLYLKACADFKTLYSNKEYMKVVYNLVQENANVSLGNEANDIGDSMDELKEMTEGLMQVVSTLGNFYAESANLVYYQTLTDANDYDPYDLDDVINNRIPNAYVAHLTNYSKFRTLYNNTLTVHNGISEAEARAQQNEAVYSTEIDRYAELLCNTSTATINGYKLSVLKSEIKNDPFGFGLGVTRWDVVPAVINDGIMKDLDHFLSCDFYVESSQDLQISVTYIITITLHPYIYTAAYQTDDSLAMKDYKATQQKAGGGTNLKGEATAAETYAMAIDLWVRTNEDDALLILEGDIVYETRPVKTEDAQGNPVDLYIYTYTDSAGKDATVRVYKKTESGNDTWYVEKSDTTMEEALTKLGISFSITADNPKQATEAVAVGYQGMNRVWDELDDPNGSAVMLPGTSLTQGSGSCYIYYPETLEDQTQSKKLLGAMRVAFVDAEGTLLATAYMDTDNSIEDSGRVIVPLRLFANTAIETGVEGRLEEYYVTRLKKNEATRITALIYLEGNGLSNSDVLSAGSITGQLNIQFGTNTMSMDPMEDKNLMDDYYAFTKIQPAGTAENPYTFRDGDDWEVLVQMDIEGITPARVTGNFISVINATQGARQPEFELTLNPTTGYYEALVRFTGGGNYQLRSLQIDGVDYPLAGDNVVYITVPGMSITSLSWGGTSSDIKKTVLTADSVYVQEMQLQLGSAEKHAVQGVFLGENGKNVTVNFSTEDGVRYVGKGTFNNSGVYKMTYLYIDGVLTALDSEKYRTLDISLGLQAEVRLSSPVFEDGVSQEEKDRILSELTFTPGIGYSFIYTGEKTLYFDITCTIEDDSGNAIKGAENVVLYYGQGTTSNALSTILEWNGREYIGRFDFRQYGIFNFNSVVIGQVNYITRTTSAHGITSIPADPMEYKGNSITQDMVFDLQLDKPTVDVKLKNASAGKVELTVADAEGKQFVLTDYETSTDRYEVTTFTFTLPGDGKWTIVGARAGTVFYNDVFYSGDDENADTWLDLMPLMVEAGSAMEVTYITQVNVQLIVEGANADGEFDLGQKTIGETFTLPGSAAVKVAFLAHDGESIAKYAAMAGKTLSVSASGEYGWTKNTITAVDTPATVQVSGSGVLTEQNSALVLSIGTFTADGKWILSGDKLTVTLDGQELAVNGMPKVIATWTKPTVTIKSINPSGNAQSKITYTRANVDSCDGGGTRPTFTIVNGSAVSNISGNTATLYAQATADNDTQAHGSFTQPKLTLTVSGVSSSATVNIVLPGGSANDITFTRTGNGDITQTLGSVSQIKSWTSNLIYTHTLDAYYGHGTQVIKTITVVCNGVSYTVTLDNPLTIINPSSVNQ